MQKRCNNVIAIFSDRENKFCKSNIDAFFLHGPQLRDAEVITSCSCRLVTILHKLYWTTNVSITLFYIIYILDPHYRRISLNSVDNDKFYRQQTYCD